MSYFVRHDTCISVLIVRHDTSISVLIVRPLLPTENVNKHSEHI